MTTMESDSESQDSDDGRRFRFEATRKDNVQGKRSRSEQVSCYNDIAHENRKDKSKHDCNRGEHRLSRERDIDDKGSKYSKYSKHSSESRNLKLEDSKEHRNSQRDVSTDSKSLLSSKHKTRDSKRHKNRDRSEHRSSRFQERCRSRNENDRSQSDKYRNKSHEKYKHHTCERSRDKSSHKIRSSDHGKFRGESERFNTHKRSREDEGGHRLQEYSSSKNVEQDYSGNESLSKRDTSVESQEYKELNLSEFDILSETDENMSDSSDVETNNSLSRTKKRNVDDDNDGDEYENTSKKQAIEIETMEGSPKVNARETDALHGSSNNNSGTISDSILGTASPMLTESRKNTVDSEKEILNATEQISLHSDSYEFVKATIVTESSVHMSAEKKTTTYGPALPPRFITNPSNDAKFEKDMNFIGPCLPKTDAHDINKIVEEDESNNLNRDNVTHEDSALDPDFTFGPALPPHLLKQKVTDKTDKKIIGPTPLNETQSFNSNNVETMEPEDEDGIGPLPANHPALESNYVHRQLEQRARQIKTEQKDEDYSMLNRREEWMTELPPAARINNLGLTSRKFRIKEGPDMSDRSCWTDTPASKAEKQRRQEEEKNYDIKTPITKLSKESDEIAYLENKKREKSLLEIHQSKQRKKKKKEEEKAKLTGHTIRRPFDRDIDLQINRFDQARMNSAINKAQYLDDRFSRGKI